MLIDSSGIPIEFMLTPGSCSDILALKNMKLNLPGGSLIFGDKAYNCYEFEDAQEENQIKNVQTQRSLNKCSVENEIKLKQFLVLSQAECQGISKLEQRMGFA
jgi:hypothetical protein